MFSTSSSVRLVIGTQPTVVGTAVLDLGGKLKGDRTRLVELGRAGVGLGIGIHQRFKQAVVGTSFAHKHLVVSQQDVGIDDPPALRTNAAGQLVENIARVLLGVCLVGQGWGGEI